MPPETPAAAPAAAADPQREQLAKLLAYISEQQATGKYSPENLWALQGPSQFPPPPVDPTIRRPALPQEWDKPDLILPHRQFVDDERFLRLPVAGRPKPREEDPFPGVVEGGGTVEEAGPYVLPKSPEKKKKGKR